MKTIKAALLVSLSLVLAFGMMMTSGCTSSSSDNGGGGGGGGTPVLASIAVTPGTASHPSTSKTQQFTATGTYDDGSTANLTTTAAWSSSNTSTATIGANTGLATTVGAGAVTITATSGTKSGTATLTVTPTYTGTIYMATEGGGHIGIFDVSIDPTAAVPITVTNGSPVGAGTRRQISGSPGLATVPKHINHDVRYDAAANRVYYSAIIPDDATISSSPTLTRAHIGYFNVATNAIVDARVDVDAGASATIMAAVLPSTDLVVGLPLVYCASSQETVGGVDYFSTLSMTVPAYIDTFKKSDITADAQLVTAGTRTRVYVSDFRANDLGGAGTDISLFAHGINSSPAGDKMFVMVNGITVDAVVTDGSVSTFPSPKSPTGFGLNVTAHPVGAFTGYLLRMSDVVAGTVTPASVLAGPVTISGMGEFINDAPTVAFRSTFTPDGTKILQSGKDRFFVLNATTLQPISTSTGTTLGDRSIGDPASNAAIENHDAMPTPDSKYAILSLRYVDSTSGGFQTGGLQLYDLTTMQPVGPVTSTCSTCHIGGSLTTAYHHICGLDGKLTAK